MAAAASADSQRGTRQSSAFTASRTCTPTPRDVTTDVTTDATTALSYHAREPSPSSAPNAAPPVVQSGVHSDKADKTPPATGVSSATGLSATGLSLISSVITAVILATLSLAYFEHSHFPLLDCTSGGVCAFAFADYSGGASVLAVAAYASR
ncbi:hypothetical protein T484DRAFT_1779092 [Baffinella frigidus]|nr:hypothetical protein T484DRAFT_1779092 [Cryptophyta sp. CCMP2293]